MALCRWSSDDFKCDLYIYQSVHGGIEVNIAVSRRTHDPSSLPEWPEAPEFPGGEIDQSDPAWQDYVRKYIERKRALMELLDNADLEPIGGPLDGRTFSFETPREVVQFLEEEVIPCGKYTFPEGLIDDLKNWELIPDDDD